MNFQLAWNPTKLRLTKRQQGLAVRLLPGDYANAYDSRNAARAISLTSQRITTAHSLSLVALHVQGGGVVF